MINSPNTFDRDDEAARMEQRLKTLAPRAARLDLNADQASRASRIANSPNRHSPFTLVGTWIFGAVAGGLLMFFIQHGKHSPLDIAPSTARLSGDLVSTNADNPEVVAPFVDRIRHRQVAAVVNGSQNRLSSASHLAMRQVSLDRQREELPKENPHRPQNSISKAHGHMGPKNINEPISRKQKLNTLLQEIAF